MKKVCEVCGEEYWASTHISARRFCSKECWFTHRRQESLVTWRCEVCGKEMTTRAFSQGKTCSRECAAASRQRRVTKRCEACGRQYEVSWYRRKESRFCSRKCTGAFFVQSNRPTFRQLQHLVVFFSQGQLAKRFEVCPTTIRNWAKQLGVLVPNKAEREWLDNLDHQERKKLAEGKEILTQSLPRGRLVKACGPGAACMPVMVELTENTLRTVRRL